MGILVVAGFVGLTWSFPSFAFCHWPVGFTSCLEEQLEKTSLK